MYSCVALYYDSYQPYSVKYVSVNGQTYKPSCAVVVDVDQSEGDPIFGKVVGVYNINERPVLCVKLLS